MTKEITYSGITYGIFLSNNEWEFNYQIAEDENGNKYQSDECTDYANFNSAVAEDNASSAEYFQYGERI